MYGVIYCLVLDLLFKSVFFFLLLAYYTVLYICVYMRYDTIIIMLKMKEEKKRRNNFCRRILLVNSWAVKSYTQKLSWGVCLIFMILLIVTSDLHEDMVLRLCWVDDCCCLFGKETLTDVMQFRGVNNT